MLAIASFSGCALSALSKPVTVERDGYSFECPASWKWEKYADDEIICYLDGSKDGDFISITEHTIDATHNKHIDGALSIDDLYKIWFNDDDDDDGLFKSTHTDIEEFSVGAYSWLKSYETLGSDDQASTYIKAVGSISSSRYLNISYFYDKEPNRKADFDKMLDSLKLI